MHNSSFGKSFVLIMVLWILGLTGCSSKEAGQLSKTDDKTTEIPETVQSDNDVSVPDRIIEEGDTEPIEISIERDDRSIDLTEYGGEGYIFTYYYETALLPDTVRNHEKINKDIEAKKEEFFATDGTGEEIDLDEMLTDLAKVEGMLRVASVKSIYLDEKYYSVNVEYYSFYGGTDLSLFRGYTYDLSTGEEVDLKSVLGMDDKELSSLLYDNVGKHFPETDGLIEYPSKDRFMDDESYGSFHYCIAGNGYIYVLYDKYSIGGGYMGSFALNICKYSDDIKNIRFSDMKDIMGGQWYNLTKLQLDEAYKIMNTRDDGDTVYTYELTPYMRDDHFYDNVLFFKYDEELLEDKAIYSADVDIDNPIKVTDTSSSLYDDMEGTYYSAETISDEHTGEIVPKNCGLISRYEIQFYNYDQNEHCYRISDKRRINKAIRRISDYLIEFCDEEDMSKVWTLSAQYEDPYYYDLYYASINDFRTDKPVDALISPKSENFEKIFASDREFLFYPSENCITDSLKAPKINNGVNYLGPDYISIHFNWNAVDGADGYEVWEEIKGENETDDRYMNPTFTEVTDHYYLTGGQDDFVHRIKVRAFKNEDGRRVFSEWSSEAIGKESNDLVGSSSITEDMNEKDIYIPVLDEYTKVFNGDESVYGMRAPGELYYRANSFDDFDINDFCYAFCNYGSVFGDDSSMELLILKKKEGKDCLYSLLYNDGSYPLVLDLDFITDSNTDDYSAVDLEPVKEGEDIFLYDDWIIAKARDEKDFSARSYIKLINEPDLVPFHWEFITTVVRVTDSKGGIKYYKSDVNQSLNYYPNEKKGLYEEISEDEFNIIQKKYEAPANLVKYPFADYKGMRNSNEDEEKAIEAYASLIKEKAADPQYPFLSVTLIHLDEDDSPELAIAYGGSHGDGVGFYGFDGAGVNEICFTGSNGVAYYEKGNGIVYGWYTGQGATDYNIGIIEDGKLKEKIMPEIAIQYDENFQETGYTYCIDESGSEESEPKYISKEEFEEILAPYSPEKRQYREIEYDETHDVHKITDIKQALRDSLEEEDNLPKPDMEFFRNNTITGE